MKRAIPDPIRLLDEKDSRLILDVCQSAVRVEVSSHQLQILTANNAHLGRLVGIVRLFLDSDGAQRDDIGMALIGLLKRFPDNTQAKWDARKAAQAPKPPFGAKAKCSVCGKGVRVRSGAVCTHAGANGEWPCDGAGKPPKEGVEDEG